MRWTCASFFDRSSDSFTLRVNHTWLLLTCQFQVICDSSERQVLPVKWPGGSPCENIQDKVWGRHSKLSLKLTGAFILESAGKEAWVSEWVSRPSWLSWLAHHHQSGLPAASQPALPRKFPHNPWRHLEMRSWRRGKNNNLGKALVGLLAKASPHDIQIYGKVSWVGGHRAMRWQNVT